MHLAEVLETCWSIAKSSISHSYSIAAMSCPPRKIMKICCFPHQEPTPEPSQEDEPGAQDGGDSPTSHLNEANPMAKDVATQLCDAAFVVEGKELKAHTQVDPAMAICCSL